MVPLSIRILDGTIASLIFVSDALVQSAELLTRFRGSIYKPKVSAEQWANRLVEHYEFPNLTLVRVKYAHLVNGGVDPEHAFRMVVE